MAYVKKEKLIENIFERVNNSVIRGWLNKIINDTPTADVVEVVRCKDCKHYEIGKNYPPYCNNVMNLFEEMKPTDYCSYGVRKDGE